MDLAARYAAFADELTFERLPANVVADTKKLILDQLGVMLVGSSADGVDSLLTTARRWGGAPEGDPISHDLGLSVGLGGPRRELNGPA